MLKGAGVLWVETEPESGQNNTEAIIIKMPENCVGVFCWVAIKIYTNMA